MTGPDDRLLAAAGAEGRQDSEAGRQPTDFFSTAAAVVEAYRSGYDSGRLDRQGSDKA